MKNGSTRSCGCGRTIDKKLTTHGMSYSPEYGIYRAMHDRCENPNHKAYERYAGRGIKVCPEWFTFEQWYKDMGPRPSSKHSIERRDNDGNYEPSNCYWATDTEQANNRRSSHLITFNDKTQSLAAWERELGFPHYLIGRRLKDGWSIEKAMTTPMLTSGEAGMLGAENRWHPPS